MDEHTDPTQLTALAQVGRVILVVGVLMLGSLLLNMVGIDFKGFGLLDRFPGGGVTARLAIGIPCLLAGWGMFRRGGGKEAVAAQKRALREGDD